MLAPLKLLWGLVVLQAPWSCGYPSGPFCIGLLMRYVANNHSGHSHLHDSHHSHCHDSLSSHFHDAWLLQLLTYASLLLPSPLTAVNVAAMDSDGDNRTGDDHHRGATTIMEVEVATTMTIGENCRYCQLVTKTGNSRNQPRDGWDWWHETIKWEAGHAGLDIAVGFLSFA